MQIWHLSGTTKIFGTANLVLVQIPTMLKFKESNNIDYVLYVRGKANPVIRSGISQPCLSVGLRMWKKATSTFTCPRTQHDQLFRKQQKPTVAFTFPVGSYYGIRENWEQKKVYVNTYLYAAIQLD